jgi:galactokinase
MSSSSALVIAVASALARLGNLQKTPAWKLNIRTTLDFAGYCACIENGGSFGALDGDAGVGTHGGSEDHSAICEGLPGRVLGFAFVPARALGAARVPDDWRFVVATSLKAKKTGGAQQSYNRLSDEAAALLRAWNESQPGPPAISLAAALATAPDAADRLRSIAGPLRHRLDHFIREDARIPEAMAAFERGDAAAVGRLADASQRDAEQLLGNQTPETSALAAAARKHGAFGASNFGAGFGGAVWALVDAARAAEFAAAWHKDAFTVAPGPALTELTTK